MKQTKHVAACLLVRAISSIFPQIKIRRAGETKKGFFCECTADHPMDSQALRMVEEELQRSILAGLPIESVEMMRENAAALLQYRNQPLLAEEVLLFPSNLVALLRINDFYSVCPLPHPADTKGIGYVKLFISKDDGSFCIEGVAKQSKKELKQYLRVLSNFKNHREIAEEEALLSINANGCFWAPRGEWIREILARWWKTCHRQMGFGIVSCTEVALLKKDFPYFQFGDQIACLSSSKRSKAASLEGGLFDLAQQTEDDAWWVLDEKSASTKMNCYLQFIKKTINMIPIDCKWVAYTKKTTGRYNQKKWDLGVQILKNALKKSAIEIEFQEKDGLKHPEIEVFFIDALGREWAGPKVELHDSTSYKLAHSKAAFVMMGSVFRSLETMIAILLEATCGMLPIWLAPEQARVLPVKAEDVDWALQIAQSIEKKGYRSSCDPQTEISLSERVYAAKKYKIPYVIVLGKGEREKGVIAVNCYSKEKETREITLDDLIEELHQISRETQFPYCCE